MLPTQVEGGHNLTDKAEAYDTKRTYYLNGQGFKILRFPNHMVLTETVKRH